jgi:RNA polymerase sigma-70 factor, ECF subfamily
MPLEFRTVFVLYELEEMTTVEVAALLQLPLGTAASRLRRARALFQETIAKIQAETVGEAEEPRRCRSLKSKCDPRA